MQTPQVRSVTGGGECAGDGSETLSTCNRPSCQELQRSHIALLIGEAGLEVGIGRKIDSREGDVSQETRFSTLHRHRSESP